MKAEQIVRQYIPEHQASMRRLIEKLERQINRAAGAVMISSF
jgi:hypothetical protein